MGSTLRNRLAHGHELFGGRRMNTDRRVELILREARFHRHREPLHDFTGFVTHHMDPEHLLALRIDNQLHHAFRLRVRESLLERPEGGTIDIDPPALFPRFRFGQADGGRGRL